ncbi:DUF1287 domain-containing protein [Neisseriaceae bacterium PsAf]|nr:DUF1287 domain-containing protein [Neisseriaceae bacterium PsAf]MCV2503246.1 DUF1287 domain-containing protein [Neisseriaceae bacterium]
MIKNLISLVSCLANISKKTTYIGILLLFYHNIFAQNPQPNPLAKGAESLPVSVKYVPDYVEISYPNGDVPQNTGVCTDVIIRAYRQIGIDLQQKVHEDIKANFNDYPSQRIWGLNQPDTNIDHRRVPNLEIFFARNGTLKPITLDSKDYTPGDIVSWRLHNGLPHIGIVVHQKSQDGKRYLIKHNIGYGQVIEDVLFKWKINGHYQY